MTVFLIIGLLLSRRFGSRIFINCQYHRSYCFIGSFSLFLPLPLQLYNFILVALQLIFALFYSHTPVFSDILWLSLSLIC